MYIQPFLLYGTALIVLSLVLLVCAIAVLYFRVNRALSFLNTEFTLYKANNEKNAREALDSAMKKSDQIIADTHLFTDEMKKGIQEAVSKSVNTGQSTYTQILSSIGDKSTKEIIEFSHSVQESIKQKATELTGQLKTEVENEQSAFKEALSKGEADILKDIQAKATKMLPEIIKDAVGSAITPEQSEELVLVSLSKIKKEHGFS